MSNALAEKDAIREVLAEYCFRLDGGDYDGMARLRSRMVERVLTSCEHDEATSETLLTILRRYATESAREEARRYCDELIAEDQIATIDVRPIAA